MKCLMSIWCPHLSSPHTTSGVIPRRGRDLGRSPGHPRYRGIQKQLETTERHPRWDRKSVSSCSLGRGHGPAKEITFCRSWTPSRESDRRSRRIESQRAIGVPSSTSTRHLRGLPQGSTPTPSRHKKMVVVLDNASDHRARLLQPWLAAHRDHFELLFFPPYSPQLAPIKHVWRLTCRLATHNLHLHSLDELVAAVESPFNQWGKRNRVLQRLCGIA